MATHSGTASRSKASHAPISSVPAPASLRKVSVAAGLPQERATPLRAASHDWLFPAAVALAALCLVLCIAGVACWACGHQAGKLDRRRVQQVSSRPPKETLKRLPQE